MQILKREKYQVIGEGLNRGIELTDKTIVYFIF